nr:MAG TPA: hypothetical protein [Crassvirales sp.]
MILFKNSSLVILSVFKVTLAVKKRMGRRPENSLSTS